jgi:hypothetical protein
MFDADRLAVLGPLSVAVCVEVVDRVCSVFACTSEAAEMLVGRGYSDTMTCNAAALVAYPA